MLSLRVALLAKHFIGSEGNWGFRDYRRHNE